ncbi:uncharacterized protein PFLUO_LOCUS5079 [Penicillium psychrofluorescens]|uniref:uncharacterized protein n=1 Tax=Penicillium psychrofluorescens TaxID=3158075 RepID=UPI003CCD6799
MDSLRIPGGIPEAWERTFAFCAPQLVDPNSDLSTQYPDLHQTFSTRMADALAARNNEPISRCGHLHPETHTRFDSREAQETSRLIVWEVYKREDDLDCRRYKICADLRERAQIYGFIGAGTFATVFLAREKHTNKKIPEEQLRHYALKVERANTILQAGESDLRECPFSLLREGGADRYIPSEALILLLLTGCDRFPMLDSVYLDGCYQTIVMSPCVDYSPDRKPLKSNTYNRCFPGFTGRFLITQKNEPLLNEMQACKVACQLLEAIAYMADMNIYHGDISINNYVVDQDLNVQLIDFGIVDFGLEHKDFQRRSFHFMACHEYQMRPELAEELTLGNYQYDLHYLSEFNVRLRHDVRNVCLWKFAVSVFGILHGYWPWDLTPGQGDLHLLNYDGGSNPGVNARRTRMMTEPVKVADHLSDECKEVLQLMLSRKPEDRPGIKRLLRQPWFQKWKSVDGPLTRPYSEEFANSFIV